LFVEVVEPGDVLLDEGDHEGVVARLRGVRRLKGQARSALGGKASETASVANTAVGLTS
jgi:hypothetical protein